MIKVAIIDYSIGNLFSVHRACEYVGMSPYFVSKPEELKLGDAAILPGVGAFAKGMENLNKNYMSEAIKEFVQMGKPFMGICLGMQLLLNSSEEFGRTEGLSMVDGDVKHLSGNIKEKHLPIPKITWDGIYRKDVFWEGTPLQDIKNGTDFYFVHSLYCDVYEKESILSVSSYGGLEYTSSIKKDNIFACQFHPEKSAKDGIIIYESWYRMCL